jgi:branched-chain amino acid transport system substrate-binding protein
VLDLREQRIVTVQLNQSGKEILMVKIKLFFIFTLISVLATSLFSACGGGPLEPSQAVTIYVGGSFALTGAYAEDTAAVLAGFQDYVKYVNETKKLAPWRTEQFPEKVTLEVLWRDDELKPEKALTIYDELKAMGMLLYRVSASQTALPLMDLLKADNIGATTMVSGAYLLTPPRTIFTNYPLYTDELAAIADWFKANWKETRKPRVAYLTADSAPGRSIDIPEMEKYLTDAGFEFVGKQFVPMVPTAPPTTQLAWLKDNQVDLALGWMINPGSQPTIKEAVRLGMGPNQAYKITFGFAAPSHLAVFAPAMGTLGDGVVVAGSYPPMNHNEIAGVAFCNELQNKYRPNNKVTHIMYLHGVIEAMLQVEALRLAMAEIPADKLKSTDVLNKGFYMIKNFSTGDITPLLTFGPGDIEGPDDIRLDQVQNGEVVFIGNYPTHGVYAK